MQLIIVVYRHHINLIVCVYLAALNKTLFITMDNTFVPADAINQ